MNAILLKGVVGMGRRCVTILQNQQCWERPPENGMVSFEGGDMPLKCNHIQDLPNPFEQIRVSELNLFEIYTAL